MIVDCHTHVWESVEQLGRVVPPAQSGSSLREGRWGVSASPRDHVRACEPVDHAVVLAFTSRYLDAEVPNGFVAEYVRDHSEKMTGFAGIDPTDPNVVEQIDEARELGLKGLVISPASQNFHPTDTRAMKVYERATRLAMPILVHQGTHYTVASKMEFANPVLFDEVAREFGQMKLILAHMGYPWVEQTVCLVGKHENVFADISGLLKGTWRAYTALLTAYQYEVIDKLFFGSDFPYMSATECIETLYNLNQIAHNGALPGIPREMLRSIIERDALDLLGIRVPTPAVATPQATAIEDEEEE